MALSKILALSICITVAMMCGVFLLSVRSEANDRVPRIESNKIVFSNSSVVPYESSKILHSNPEDALKHGEAVSVSEQPILVKVWRRVILVKTANLYEGSTKEVTVYDYQGRSLSSSMKIVGDVLFLKPTKRILLAQKSAHYLVKESYLLDQDGKLLATIKHDPNVSDSGSSKDGKVIWIVSSYVESGKPVGRAAVFDSNGTPLRELRFVDSGLLTVEYAGQRYRIAVKKPEIPG